MKSATDVWFENGEKAYKKGLYGRALSWLLKAAEQGDHRAMKRLGDMYYRGDGVKEDIGKALDWYRKAFHNGNGEAGRLEEQIIHVINLSI